MKKKKKENPYARGKQILRALYEHGPLSNKGIRSILVPYITKCGVRQALATLKYKGLVVRRFDSIPENWSNFYQISLREENRPHLAKILDLNPLNLTEPIVHDHELIHSQECAIWCERFRRMFPQAKVLREHHFIHEKKMKDILFLDRDNYKLKPDILMQFQHEDERRPTTIAIEIERSHKSCGRLNEKLRKLATETMLDGVIYICSKDSISETIRLLYEKKIRKDALRINHYGNNFFLFGSGRWSHEFDGPDLMNSEYEQINLYKWVDFLVTNEWQKRRIPNQELTANA